MSLIDIYQSNGSVLLAFTSLVIVINCFQNLVDCDNEVTDFGNGITLKNNGCDGGLTFLATMYAQKHGLANRSDYEYVGVSKKCQNVVAMIVSHIRPSAVDVYLSVP